MTLMVGFGTPKEPPFSKKFSRAIGTGLDAVGEAVGKYKENEALKKYGIDLTDIRDPQVRQQLVTDQLKYGRNLNLAKASQDINLSPKAEKPVKPQEKREDRQPFEEARPQKKDLPGFEIKKPERFFDTKEDKTRLIGNAPQPETTGQKRPVLNPDQLLGEADRLQGEYNARHIPMSKIDALNLARDINNENKLYNKEVEADIQQRVNAQRQYGDLGVQKLLKVMPNSTDEQQAFFKKKGEDASTKYTSEADIDKELSQEARNFKNTIANVKKSIPAPRLLSNIKGAILGINRDFDKTKSDIRIKLKPLLDQGLYDTSRDLLSGLGYHPEEREMIISDLGENSKKSIAGMPILHKEVKLDKGELSMEFNPESREAIKQNMLESLQSDPSANLILLRKAYEDKDIDIDWRMFKDNLNEMIMNGQIKLNDDQFNQLDKLDFPPLDRLDKILHGLKLIGR